MSDHAYAPDDVAALVEAAREAAEEPALVKAAPTSRPVRRLDEVLAAKRLVLRYGYEAHPDLAAERAAAAGGAAT